MASEYEMIGPALALGLSSFGSAIGCFEAGAAAQAAMARTEEGHGKYLGMSAAPSSQAIYGFVLMLMMRNALQAGSVGGLSAIGIGLGAGAAMFASGVFQGKVCASGIQASMRQPAVYGKCWAAIGIIESFALFAFVFSLFLM